VQTVKQAWDSFAQAVIPPDAPEVQYAECRRAFYAGAWAVLQGCALLGEPDVSEDAGVLWLSATEAELNVFAEDVKAGRA